MAALLILVSTVAASYMYVDFLMAELEFVQVKRTFDDKLKVVEIAGVLVGLISAALKQWPLSNCSLLFQQNETFVGAAPDQAYTVLIIPVRMCMHRSAWSVSDCFISNLNCGNSCILPTTTDRCGLQH